jgi:hypothetical protein
MCDCQCDPSSAGDFVASPQLRTAFSSATAVGTQLPGFLAGGGNCQVMAVPPSGWTLTSVFFHFTLNSGAALPAGATMQTQVQEGPTAAGPWTVVAQQIIPQVPDPAGYWVRVNHRFNPGTFVRTTCAVLGVPLVASGAYVAMLVMKD